MTLKDADELIKLIDDDIASLDMNMPTECYYVCLCTLQMAKLYILALPTIEAEPIVRCKDCKHKPTGSGINHDIQFPSQDYKCPCRCEDYWYSWMPADDWFCANGERKSEVEE